MNYNPYEIVYRYQNELIDLVAQKQEIEGKIKDLQNFIKQGIAEGEATGKEEIDGYTCVTERKTTEKRTLRKDLLTAEIILNHGTFKADFAARYIPIAYRNAMIMDKDLCDGYDLKLGELDKALGGKKNSVDFVDIEIKEDVSKRITRLPQAPIIEV